MNLSTQIDIRVDLASDEINNLRKYIKQTWTTLTRSPDHAVAAAIDDKVAHASGKPWIIYVSAKEDIAKVEVEFERRLPPEKFKHISLETLPAEADHIEEHGLK